MATIIVDNPAGLGWCSPCPPVDNSPLYCTTLDQMICCLRTSQCPFSHPPKDRQISQGGCYVDEFRRERMARYKPRGSKVPCR